MTRAALLLTALAVAAAACAPDATVRPPETTEAPTSTATATPPPSTTTTRIPDSTTTTSTRDPFSTSTTSTTATPATTSTTTTSTTTTTTTTTAPPSTTTTTMADDFDQLVRLRIESRIDDVTTDEFATEALNVLNDARGWIQAGFTFVRDDDAEYLLVLAEGPEVDQLCLPLDTATKVSCQNGPVVALNADRWRVGVTHWDSDLAEYRGYLVNHEVGHLIGQRHPTPRCPVQGRPAGVMEPQTGNLKGCKGNAWPRAWEIGHASQRPVVYAPLPDWGPDPIPPNLES